jgi:hypothetical protein
MRSIWDEYGLWSRDRMEVDSAVYRWRFLELLAMGVRGMPTSSVYARSMRKRTLDTSLYLPTADPALLVGFHSHALSLDSVRPNNCIAKNLATFSRAASSPTILPCLRLESRFRNLQTKT